MNSLIIILLIFVDLSLKSTSVSVKIDGLIDLGPNWNIEYSVNTVPDEKQVFIRNKDAEETPKDDNTENKEKEDITKENISQEGKTEKDLTTKVMQKDVTEKFELIGAEETINKEDDVSKETKKPKKLKESHKDNIRVHESDVGSEEPKIAATSKATQTVKSKKKKKITTKTFSGDEDNNNNEEAKSVAEGDQFDLGSMIRIKKVKPKTTSTTKKPKATTTQYIKSIFQEPHLVKDDPTVREFIEDIRKNSLNFFSKIKTKVDDVRSKNKVDFLKRSYEERFGEFLNETQGQKILTRLGTQKVILNVIDTSNGIMKRLVNYLIGDMQKKGSLRAGVTGLLEGELLNEEKQEYTNACQKFGICRTKDRFSLFAAEFLTEALAGDDNKVRVIVNSFTEVLKEANYDRFGGDKIKKQIAKTMDWIDLLSGKQLRPLVMTFKNMLVSKNRPLVVMPDAYGTPMNKSVAFLDLIDAIDDKLPPTDSAVSDWNDSINSVREWISGLRSDPLEIVTKFCKQFLNKAAGRMKGRVIEKVSENLKILFQPPDKVSSEVVL